MVALLAHETNMGTSQGKFGQPSFGLLAQDSFIHLGPPTSSSRRPGEFRASLAGQVRGVTMKDLERWYYVCVLLTSLLYYEMS